MADNVDKEDKDNLTNTEAENPSDVVIPASDTEAETLKPAIENIENPIDKGIPDSNIETDSAKEETENMETPIDKGIPDSNIETDTAKEETENMEVHHHGHHGHHAGKRSRQSYFWEFLMLFLAVCCGFVAEYLLEHKIENDREKVFIETMINDLKEDTSLLGASIIKYKQKGIEIDSLTILLNSANINTNGSALYYYGRIASRFDFFTSTDRTIEQMKNSGAFRLIRNNDAASGISQYYSEMNGLYLFQNNTNDLAMEYRSMAYTLFDPVVFETMVNDETQNVIIKPVGNPSLNSHDKSDVVRLGSMLHYMKASRLVLYDRYIYLRNKAIELIELLKKEYHLE